MHGLRFFLLLLFYIFLHLVLRGMSQPALKFFSFYTVGLDEQHLLTERIKPHIFNWI